MNRTKSSFSSNNPSAIHPFLQIGQGQNSGRVRNWLNCISKEAAKTFAFSSVFILLLHMVWMYACRLKRVRSEIYSILHSICWLFSDIFRLLWVGLQIAETLFWIIRIYFARIRCSIRDSLTRLGVCSRLSWQSRLTPVLRDGIGFTVK